MLRYAIKMMVGDRAKYIGILVGLTFATFIITQQAGIFVGLMIRTYGFLTDTKQADIWVTDDQVQYVEEVEPVRFSKLYQVRGVQGVKWAVPLFKGFGRTRMQNGVYQRCQIIGIDDATLIGGPPNITEGSLLNLRSPDAVILNEEGRSKLGYPELGDVLEINDRRARIVGFCELTRTFLTQPVFYTTFNRAVQYTPSERNILNFILVKGKENTNLDQLCRHIELATQLGARTTKQFMKLTILYYLLRTGIPINFGFAVLLGFIIGIAISGQTFYSFAHDNRRYFATLKAMGATNQILAKMMAVQALMTAGIGWGLGIGITSLFGFANKGTELSFVLPWWLAVISFIAIILITMLSALAALRKVSKLDPGIVFQT